MSAAMDLVLRTCAAQKLPATITDPGVLDRVAALLAPERGDTPDAAPGYRKDLLQRASVEEVVRA
jgi:hypothetical protein